MDIFRAAERMMAMDDRVWARHANPLSGWSRMATLPALALVIFYRDALGPWLWLAMLLIAVWTWLNPRLFPPPTDHDSWPARGVVGERWFLARARMALPRHHVVMCRVLTVASALGLPPLIWGLWIRDAGWTCFGVLLTMLPKLWFLDRMNWILQDMTGSAPGTPLPSPKLPPAKDSL